MSSGYNDRAPIGLINTVEELEEIAKEEGTKYDNSKPMISLVPSEAITAAARAMSYGANKYSAHNFKGGIKHSRLIDAAFRHLLAYNKGENIDPESKLSHIDHALASLSMLQYMIENRPELDDRYRHG